MPETKGEIIWKAWVDKTVNSEALTLRIFCLIATQLERIADRMDDALENGLPITKCLSKIK